MDKIIENSRAEAFSPGRRAVLVEQLQKLWILVEDVHPVRGWLRRFRIYGRKSKKYRFSCNLIIDADKKVRVMYL